MLSGATASALAMAGTAVFKIVVSSDSMKNATATSHGSNRFADSPGDGGGATTELVLARIMLVTISISGLCVLANDTVAEGRRVERQVGPLKAGCIFPKARGERSVATNQTQAMNPPCNGRRTDNSHGAK